MLRSSHQDRVEAHRSANDALCPDRDGAPKAGASAFDDVLGDTQTVVHDFVFCPPLAAGTRYLLVRKTSNGQMVVLHAAHASSTHAPSNLAQLRFIGARLGATEAHVLTDNSPAASSVVMLPKQR